MSTLTVSLPQVAPYSGAATPGAPSAFRVAVYEGAGAEPFDPATKLELVRALLAAGTPVSVVRPGTVAAPPSAGTLAVVGRFTGEVPAEAQAGEVAVRLVNAGAKSAAELVEAIGALRAETTAARPAWKPWFPVIDYDRCTNCMQCLSFCLFDVYGVSADKKIQVQNQSKCKTDCPACSRVCPEVAILFPKYRHGPINGDVVNSDDLRRESMKVDITALLGGDIYQALRDRSVKSRSRFAKERDDARALEERQRCLIKLGEKLDIPAEVFSSLPTAEEIRAKSEAAQARGAAALADANSGGQS